jgi:hypothetical protein
MLSFLEQRGPVSIFLELAPASVVLSLRMVNSRVRSLVPCRLRGRVLTALDKALGVDKAAELCGLLRDTGSVLSGSFVLGALEGSSWEGIDLVCSVMVPKLRDWLQEHSNHFWSEEPRLKSVSCVTTFNLLSTRLVEVFGNPVHFVTREADLAFLQNWFDGRALHLDRLQALASLEAEYRSQPGPELPCYCGSCRLGRLFDRDRAQIARIQKFVARGFTVSGFSVRDHDVHDFKVRVVTVRERGETRRIMALIRHQSLATFWAVCSIEKALVFPDFDGVPVAFLQESTAREYGEDAFDALRPLIHRALDVYSNCC